MAKRGMANQCSGAEPPGAIERAPAGSRIPGRSPARTDDNRRRRLRLQQLTGERDRLEGERARLRADLVRIITRPGLGWSEPDAAAPCARLREIDAEVRRLNAE